MPSPSASDLLLLTTSRYAFALFPVMCVDPWTPLKSQPEGDWAFPDPGPWVNVCAPTFGLTRNTLYTSRFVRDSTSRTAPLPSTSDSFNSLVRAVHVSTR